jgi:hypothetical protein
MPDRLTLTRAFEGAGLQSEAAEKIATEIYDAIHDNVATKTDLRDLEGRVTLRFEQLERRIDAVEHRLITRLGGLIIAAGGLLFAALRYWPPHQ